MELIERLGIAAEDWVLIAAGATVVLVGVVEGIISWLKGRKFTALLVWILLGALTILVLAPVSWTEGLLPGFENQLDADPELMRWGLIGAVALVLALGLLSSARLAKPSSWWAQRRYTSDKYDRAVERHGWAKLQAR